MNDNSKVHFTKLTLKERESKLRQLHNLKGEVIIWLKGRAIRETYNVVELTSKNIIKVYPQKSEHLINNDVLFKFELNGLHFFSQGKLVKDRKSGFYSLEITDEVFKSERRSNFRLITYPTYDVRVLFRVIDNYSGSNVVDINSRTSETNIFKSFLTLIGQGTDTEGFKEVEYRVQDISVSGISFLVGDAEKDFFIKGEQIENFKIIFDNEDLIVTGAKVVYNIDFLAPHRKGVKQYKIGLNFDKLSTNMDNKLGKKINDALRNNESNDEFEDFIS